MHEGHRQRMYEKLANGDSLFDHEVLEILLYNACPRVNTNPIAHALLDRFCSISEILRADAEELKSVKGVGDGIAHFLKTVGLCAERAGNIEGAAVLKTFGDCKNFVSMRLRGKTEEFLELYFLGKNGCVKRIYTYTSADRNRVETDAREIVRNVAFARPHGIIAAHNHLNSSNAPSDSDDVFTKQLQLIADLNNAVLWDHLIYSEKAGVYSYKDTGRLSAIAENFSLDSIVKWIKTSNST